MKEIQKRTINLYNIHGCVNKNYQSGTWRIDLSLFSAVELCNKMFKDAPFFLKRKYECYKNFVIEKANNLNDIRYSEDKNIIRDAIEIVKSIDSKKIIGSF